MTAEEARQETIKANLAAPDKMFEQVMGYVSRVSSNGGTCAMIPYDALQIADRLKALGYRLEICRGTYVDNGLFFKSMSFHKFMVPSLSISWGDDYKSSDSEWELV